MLLSVEKTAQYPSLNDGYWLFCGTMMTITRFRFSLASFICLGLSILSYMVAAGAFLSVTFFMLDERILILLKIGLFLGFWTEVLGALIAVVGLFATPEQKLACLVSLILNCIPTLTVLSIWVIGQIVGD